MFSRKLKRMIAVLLVAILMLSGLSAGDYQDISLFLGTHMDEFRERGLTADFGMNLGLSSIAEMSLGVASEMLPVPFSDNTAYLEFNFALMGPVGTASRVAGVGVNSMLGFGGFFSYDSDGGKMKAGPYVSITPLAFGNPISGRRERVLKTDIGYDAINNQFYWAFSLVRLDYYVRGTYRDYF